MSNEEQIVYLKNHNWKEIFFIEKAWEKANDIFYK